MPLNWHDEACHMPLNLSCDNNNHKNPEKIQTSGKISQDFRFQYFDTYL